MTHLHFGSIPIHREKVSKFLLHIGAAMMVCDAIGAVAVTFHFFPHTVEFFLGLCGKTGAASAGVGASLETLAAKLMK